MHAIEKILAKNSGRAEVHTGEIVTAKVDFAEINDLYLQTVYSFYEMGGEKVWNRERRLSSLITTPLPRHQERSKPQGDARVRQEERPALPL